MMHLVAVAFWIAIGSAAPEFIWRGARIALAHAGPEELWGALFTGLILAFFVEPVLERLRGLVPPGDAHPHGTASPGFTTLVGLGFALGAICVHDAMTAFLHTHAAGKGPRTGLGGALSLTIGWSLIPFMVTLAWLRRNGAIRWLLAAGAATSPVAAGLLFSWPHSEVATTALPCLLILLLGLRSGERRPHALARLVAGTGTAWMVLTGLADLLLGAIHHKGWAPYSAGGFWMDVRFYLGWTMGLLLAPPLPSSAGMGAERGMEKMPTL